MRTAKNEKLTKLVVHYFVPLPGSSRARSDGPVIGRKRELASKSSLFIYLFL